MLGDKIYSQLHSKRQFWGISDFYLTSGVFVECLNASHFDCQGEQSPRRFSGGKYAFPRKISNIISTSRKRCLKPPHATHAFSNLCSNPACYCFCYFYLKARRNERRVTKTMYTCETYIKIYLQDVSSYILLSQGLGNIKCVRCSSKLSLWATVYTWKIRNKVKYELERLFASSGRSVRDALNIKDSSKQWFPSLRIPRCRSVLSEWFS